ncbi:hypothetical protein [uncultured Brevundimonas sp.]|uniref:hypothetical protein n=1 Tax=uncultured Brevundimonas sp. TaxID=213418 RepID=UPI0030ED3310|tara:strand:+ start:3275 stop:3754 length:480 start_codon:yes stop_codon:yes gene_type:complete
MKYRHFLAAAAAVALTIPATTAAAQSWPEILGAVVQAQTNNGYNNGYNQYGDYRDNQYGDYRNAYGRVSQRQAIQIAQRQGVRVQSVNQRGNHYDLVGRDNYGQRVSLRVDARTGQISRFDRQQDRRNNGRWNRDDQNHREHDRRDHRRDHQRDHDDDD